MFPQEGRLMGPTRLNAQVWNGQGVAKLCNSTAGAWILFRCIWHALHLRTSDKELVSIVSQ